MTDAPHRVILPYTGEQPATIEELPAIAARVMDEEKIIDGKFYRLGCIVADVHKAPNFIQELHYIAAEQYSKAESDAADRAGAAVRDAMIEALPDETTTLNLMNACGSILVSSFVSTDYNSHDERLIEFDSWCRYTRKRIDEEAKKGMN